MNGLSTGEGILIGLLAFSLVFLIVKTQDKWKWGRIFLVLVALPILVGLVSIGIEYYKSIPKTTWDYAGLSLNMPRKDVIFLKGHPDKVIDSGSIKSDELLVYDFRYYKDINLVVSITREAVTAVELIGDPDYSSGLFGVYSGSAYEDVIKRLGEPSRTKEFSDVSRGLYYAKYNIVVGIYEGEVMSVGISYDPEYFGWLNVTPTK